MTNTYHNYIFFLQCQFISPSMSSEVFEYDGLLCFSLEVIAKLILPHICLSYPFTEDMSQKKATKA